MLLCKIALSYGICSLYHGVDFLLLLLSIIHDYNYWALDSTFALHTLGHHTHKLVRKSTTHKCTTMHI